jgi:hypothetical protein
MAPLLHATRTIPIVGVIAIPNPPAKGHAGSCFRTRPRITMHEWQASSENVNARRRDFVQHVATQDVPLLLAAAGLEEGQSQKHDHQGGQLESVRDEPLDVSIRRVGQNALAIDRHRRRGEKVALAVEREPVIFNVGGDHRVTGRAQGGGDVSPPRRRFPNGVGQLLDPEQRWNRHWWCSVKIEPAFGEGVPLRLTGMVQRHDALLFTSSVT